MNLSEKTLKVVCQKQINCYLVNAYFLCIILAYDNMLPWVYENYVQLYYCPSKAERNSSRKEVFLDFYGGFTDPQQILDFSARSRAEMEQVDIIEFIERAICNNYYFYTYIDEYYTVRKGLAHNSHDIFIYGYDRVKRNVKVIGFNDRKDFSLYTIDYDMFRIAYKSGIEVSKMNDIYGGRNYGTIIDACFDGNTKYRFHVKPFLENLYDYVNSKNTSERIYSKYLLYRSEGNVYGIDVYDQLAAYIEMVYNCDNEGLIDYRPFHTIYEHKKLMTQRMAYIGELYEIPDYKQELVTPCTNLESKINVLRRLAIKYSMNQKRHLLKRMLDYVPEIKEMESLYFNKIYSVVSRYSSLG